jgi:hypothetical protein
MRLQSVASGLFVWITTGCSCAAAEPETCSAVAHTRMLVTCG